MTVPLRALADKWLYRLAESEPGDVVLSQRRVFLLPSKAGLGFGVLLAVMFVGSITYNLSLGFALTFLVAAFGVVDMHLTFRNLAYLQLSAGRAAPVFAGEDAQFEMHLLNRRGHDRFAIWIGFTAGGNLPPQRAISRLRMQPVDIAATSSTAVTLSTPTTQRGWLPAPRVRLSTQFPLGLLQAWSYWRPKVSVLVYPQPEVDAPPLPLTLATAGNGARLAGDDDTFAGVRAYRLGDSIRQMAWRQIARMDPESGGALVTKQFEGGSAGDLMLDFNTLPRVLELDLRLSRMTRWVLEAESRSLAYAFRLGSLRLEAALGPAQQQACLRALALYEGT
ncbi:MAG: DUF58 domain-containing protein [Burkholderiaceae bacterium]